MGKSKDKLLSQWISKIGDTYFQKIAIVHGDKKITYAQLCDSIQRLAGGLISLGIQRGDRVALLLKNSPEFIISFFAITKVGAIAVPMNIQYKEQELTNYIRDSKPKIIIASTNIIPTLTGITFFTNNRDCAIIGVPDGKDGVYSFTNLIKEDLAFNDTVNLLPQDAALFQYSSGSTGKPKRIIRSHFNLVSEAENFCSTVNITSNDKILCVVPLSHAHGLGNCMLASIHSGAILVILEDFNRRKVLEMIQTEQITVFPGVPFMFSILADTSMRKEIDCSSVKLCFSAGAPLPQRTFQKFYDTYGIFVRQLYGSTETGSVSINLDEDISKTVESVGLPMNNVEVEIFGVKDEIIKTGDIGNIGIRSPAMIKGYSEQKYHDKESFKNGYFFSGDLGKKDNRGNTYITGRNTLFINTGANKVDSSEIEALLRKHPKVNEVVVLGIKSHYGEDVIKAVVVPHCQFDESELIEFCRGKIAEFKIPRVVEFRKEIPKSPLGKVLRKYLC